MSPQPPNASPRATTVLGLLLAFSCSFILPTPVGAADPANPNARAPVRQLLNYLASVYQKKTLTGFATLSIDSDSYSGINYVVTGKREAIQALDMQWTDLSSAGLQRIVDDYRRTGTILGFHHHWFFNGESAWKDQRTNQVNVAAVITAGTPEHTEAMAELAKVADALRYLDDHDVPVLWRPLHELSGGWFWWTDLDHPENTAALYRMIYNYFTVDRQLNNLLWVWNTGGNIDARFYPGDQFVDIIGDDIYNSDFRNGRKEYWNSWNALKAVAPSKMIALCECGELPNPDLMQSGATPPWLYALMWFGAGQYGNPRDWTIYAMRHDWMLTRDRLPVLAGTGNISPQLGILSPLDNGEGRFNGAYPVIQVCATDLDGSIERVEFFANGIKVGTATSPPYMFNFTNAAPGIYNTYAVAYDTNGAGTKSQTVRLSFAVADLAWHRPTVTSSAISGSEGANAVDGNYWTAWVSDNTVTNPDDQWIYVDLGSTNTIQEADLSWYWKVFGQDYTIDVAITAPDNSSSWTTVYRVQSAAIDEYPDKAFHQLKFAAVSARYVRMHATKRSLGQTWGGYDLTAFEIPVPTLRFGTNALPFITAPAAATPPNTVSYSSQLHVAASDADNDYLSYTWSVAGSNGAGVTFSPNGTIFAQDTTVHLPKAGTYVLRATVTDGQGGSTNSEVSVTQAAINGALLTDDRSSQSGNGLGAVDAVSHWNTFALRFVLEQPLFAQSATLRIFRDAADSAPIVATVSEASSDNWTEANGPVPGPTAAIASQSVSRGGVWMTFDVTDFVNSRVGSGTATMVLSTDQNTWNTSVHTRNYSNNPPQLVIVKAIPALSAAIQNGQFQLRWQNWASNYGLYWRSSLSSASWLPLLDGVQMNYTNFSLTLDLTTYSSRFFQLRTGP
jgi:mannan endo-1,4-beta-mannosidase